MSGTHVRFHASPDDHVCGRAVSTYCILQEEIWPHNGIEVGGGHSLILGHGVFVAARDVKFLDFFFHFCFCGEGTQKFKGKIEMYAILSYQTETFTKLKRNASFVFRIYL